MITTKLIPVTQWSQHHSWPPIGGLRHLIFFADVNGFDKVIKRVGRRILIDEAAFFKWASKQNGESLKGNVMQEPSGKAPIERSGDVGMNKEEEIEYGSAMGTAKTEKRQPTLGLSTKDILELSIADPVSQEEFFEILESHNVHPGDIEELLGNETTRAYEQWMYFNVK